VSDSYPGKTLEVKKQITVTVQGEDLYTMSDGVREYLEIVKAREWSEQNWRLSCLFTFLEEELRKHE